MPIKGEPLTNAIRQYLDGTHVTSSKGVTYLRPNRGRNRLKKLIKKQIMANKEPNSHDTSASAGTEVNSTGLLVNLTDMGQGDGSGERLRDTVTLKYAHLKLILTGKSAAAATTNHAVRVALIRWKVDNAAEAPSMAILLRNSDYISQWTEEPDDRAKFDVLYDKLFTYGGVNSATGVPIKYVRVFRKLSGKVRYAAAGTTGRGHIYLMLLGHNGTGNEAATYQSHNRLGYVD